MKIKAKKSKNIDRQLRDIEVRKKALKKIIRVITKNNNKIKKS